LSRFPVWLVFLSVTAAAQQPPAPPERTTATESGPGPVIAPEPEPPPRAPTSRAAPPPKPLPPPKPKDPRAFAPFIDVGGLALVSLITNSAAAYFPIGFQFALSDSVTWVAEGAFSINTKPPTSPFTASWRQAVLGFGPLFSTHKATEMKGLFVHPKILGVYSNERGTCCEIDAEGQEFGHVAGRSYELQLGIDAGYQFRFFEVLVAPMLGVSAGYCWNCGDRAPTSLYGPRFWDTARARVNKLTWAFNVNLVRFGWVF
jgi:hypothetical protein